MKVSANIRKENPYAKALSFYYGSNDFKVWLTSDIVHRNDGFKFRLQITDQELSMGYVVTEASCHD